jgi:hypothetical protein
MCGYAFMKARDHYGITDDMAVDWIHTSRSTGEFVERVHSHVRASLGKPVFVEKTPSNVYSFLRFARELPDVPLIHVIRDGRDVAVSLRRRGYNLFGAGSRWLYDVSAGLRARGAQGYLELRYEELLGDPHSALIRVFEHLGVDPTVDVLGMDPDRSGAYATDWRRRRAGKVWQHTPNEPISVKSIGQYKASLSADDMSTLLRIALTQQATRQLGIEPITLDNLLTWLGYQDGQRPSTGHRPTLYRRLREKWLERKDYGRRSRHSRRGGGVEARELPLRCTYIASFTPGVLPPAAGCATHTSTASRRGAEAQADPGQCTG